MDFKKRSLILKSAIKWGGFGGCNLCQTDTRTNVFVIPTWFLVCLVIFSLSWKQLHLKLWLLRPTVLEIFTFSQFSLWQKLTLTFSGFLFQQLEVQSSEIAGDYSLWDSNVAAISHFAVMLYSCLQIWTVSHEVFQPRVLHYMNIRSENYAGNKLITAGN